MPDVYIDSLRPPEQKTTSRFGVLLAGMIVLFMALGLVMYTNRIRFQRPQSTSSNNNANEIPVTLIGIIDKTTRTAFDMRSDSKTYTVMLADDAKISRKNVQIPYLFSPHPADKKQSVTVADIDEGMSVEVSGLAKGTTIKAQTVLLPRITFVLEGIIKEKGAGALTVDAVPVFEMPRFDAKGQTIPPEHTDYAIQISTDTEISREVEGEGPKRFTLSELEAGDRVIIYANADVTASHTITAARIEPVM